MTFFIDGQEWRIQALCGKHRNPEFWFPDRTNTDVSPALRKMRTREAKTICHMCPVFFACREQAVENSESFGIWAGEDLGSFSGRKNVASAFPRIPSPEMVELYSSLLPDYDRRIPHENGPLTA